MTMHASEDNLCAAPIRHRHRHHHLTSPPSQPPPPFSAFSSSESSESSESSSSSSRVLSTSLCQRQMTAADGSEDGRVMMMNNSITSTTTSSKKSSVVTAAAKRLCSLANNSSSSQQYSHWLLKAAASLCCWCYNFTTTTTTTYNQTNQPNKKSTKSCPCQAGELDLVVPGSSKSAANGRSIQGNGCGLGQLRLLLLLLVTFAACLSVQVAPVVTGASVIGGGIGGGGGQHAHAAGAGHGNHGQIIITAANEGHLGGGGGGHHHHNTNINSNVRQQVVDIEEEAAAALVKQYHQQLEDDSPPCADEHSICGYVQVNSVGFNRVSLCSCGDGENGARRCPLWWERSTSRTVRHGNDFYKYCSRKPRLLPCASGQVAYSAVSEYDKLTFEKVSVVHRAHCLCPADHILAANSSKPGFEQELEGSLLFGTEMLCTKIPRCSRRQFCLSISESVDATLEQRHCRCPPGQTCPKDPRQAAETHQMLRGAAYHMRCL